MMQWIKNHSSVLITILVTVGVAIYFGSCEPTVRSLNDSNRFVNRQELQLELDQLISLAELRMLDLEQQERFHQLILQNALVLVQGQPLNPVGIITGIAAIYGAAQGGRNVRRVVKTKIAKGRENNA